MLAEIEQLVYEIGFAEQTNKQAGGLRMCFSPMDEIVFSGEGDFAYGIERLTNVLFFGGYNIQ